MLTAVLILGGIVILISVGLLALMFMKSNEVNLTGKTEDKPEWMKSNPPKETVNATRVENEGVTLFDHDAGERIASPFAEQIEDILRAKLESDPFNKFDIDFGSAPDGSLEIWVNGSMYPSMDDLPDEGLKNAFRNAVKEWERVK
ncbi:hypothetical protein [Candidatus Villigracilis affinis]|jgi:hypothetical protein|uniref:hypothetical protein n=1 Tax=Candidatus Villigracilis affinis TaxID=3140682 RepID=UPI001D45B61A|nr:hypothetical protein [Anaerolineales bacterium]MBL0346325.1 hypothetical protein [Anaerolineales bacterium]